MRINFDDSEYKFENGRAPKGYGSWGFQFEGYEFWAHGTLAEAKKACRAEVKRLAPAGYGEDVDVCILP